MMRKVDRSSVVLGKGLSKRGGKVKVSDKKNTVKDRPGTQAALRNDFTLEVASI